jgi:hypothetical protein
MSFSEFTLRLERENQFFEKTIAEQTDLIEVN